MRLQGKACIVTGGGSGLGRATCLLFAREEAKVAVADRDVGAAERTAAEAAELGAETLALAVDVARSADCARMVEATGSMVTADGGMTAR